MNFCCRTTDELMDKALEAAKLSRRLQSNFTTRFLPSRSPAVWGKGNPYHGANFAVAVVDPKKKRPRSDAEFMQLFLKNSSASSLCDPGLIEFDKLYVDGAPILDFLAVDVKYAQTWAFPSYTTVALWQANRGISPLYPRMVDVREYRLGVDTLDYFTDFTAWFWECYNRNQSEFPSKAVSFDTEQVVMCRYDYLRMMHAGPGRFRMSKGLNDSSRSEDFLIGEEDKWKNLATKIFFGDGITWCAVFSLPITESEKGRYFDNTKWDSRIADFFASLPLLVGLGVREDAVLTEEILTLMIPGSKVRIKSCELAALAVLAGYCGPTNMTAMSVIALGGSMNKDVSRGDGKWHLPYSRLPQSMRAYLVSDIRFGHIAWNTFMSYFLREAFPEPEVTCRYTDLEQVSFVEWFASELVPPTICEVAVHDKVRMEARTREQLVLSLQYRNLSGKFAGTPQRVRDIFALVHAATPTLAHGGPRYLHLAREHFIGQFCMLKTMGCWPEIFKADLTDVDRMHIMFGRPYPAQLDWSLSPHGDGEATQPAGLLVHPGLRDRIPRPCFKGTTKYLAFRREAQRLEIGLRMLVFEWVRLDVRERAPRFFQWLATPATWRHFKGLANYLVPMLKLAVNEGLYDKMPQELAVKMTNRRTEAVAKEVRKLDALHEAVKAQQAQVDRVQGFAWRRGEVRQQPALPASKRTRVDQDPVDSAPADGRKGELFPTQLARFSKPITLEQIRERPTWISRIVDEDGQDLGPETTGQSVTPSMQPLRLREADEHPLGAAGSRRGRRKRKFSEDEEILVQIRNPGPVLRLTQDQVEEDDGPGADHFINFSGKFYSYFWLVRTLFSSGSVAHANCIAYFYFFYFSAPLLYSSKAVFLPPCLYPLAVQVYVKLVRNYK